MTNSVIVAGRPVHLGKTVGRGGEGEVRALGDGADLVKLYFKPDAARESKVRVMVELGLARRAGLVAFPLDIATDKGGRFLGFTMRAVSEHRPIHMLASPKSRRAHFPTADYRFLIRTAGNTARAIAEVHAMGCTVGDINHSGILVSAQATVSLIDADSFQLSANGNVYPCLVGVPDYTPPELQGKSLVGVHRTVAHDHFGLAVMIFQLLFMGRHPYAGETTDGATPLEDLIARKQFAFSRERATGSRPPKGVLTLDAFSADVAAAFERAFGLDPDKRPSAAAWIGLLERLERELSRCGVEPMHYFPSASRGCPWCRIENQIGAALFTPSASPSIRIPKGPSLDIDQALQALRAMVIFDPETLHPPPAPAFSATPSQAARDAKSSATSRKIFGAIGIVLAVGLLAAFPPLWIIWIGAALFAGNMVWNAPGLSNFSQALRQSKDRYASALGAWRKSFSVGSLVALHSRIVAAIEEFRGLDAARQSAQDEVDRKTGERRLNAYLDRFFISAEPNLPYMTPIKVQRLAARGIETAADIDYAKVIAVHGFGPATTEALVHWRQKCERGFNRNAPPSPADLQADAAAKDKVVAEFQAKAVKLTNEIQGGLAELQSGLAALNARIAQRSLDCDRIAAEIAQHEADIAFVSGASAPTAGSAAPAAKPPSPIPLSATAWPQQAPAQATARTTLQTSGAITCPSCGSRMVRRTARKGRRRGRQFWGCSRYPSCTGTRP